MTEVTGCTDKPAVDTITKPADDANNANTNSPIDNGNYGSKGKGNDDGYSDENNGNKGNLSNDRLTAKRKNR